MPNEVVTRFKVPRIRSEPHLRWIRSLGYCALCGRRTDEIEAHHDRRFGDGGIGMKPGDDKCVNLCFWCHREGHTSGWEQRERHYGKSLKAAAAWLAFHSRTLGILR